MTKKLTKEQKIEDYTTKIAQLNEGIDNETKTKSRYQKQVDNWRELQSLKVEGVKKGILNPDYEHHKDSRFWELTANEMQFKIEEETAQQNSMLTQFDHKIEMLSNELKLYEEQLKELEGK